MGFYRHTQIGWPILLPTLAALGGCLAAWAAAGPHPVLLAASVAIAVTVLLFGSLTVEVGGGTAALRFGCGLIRRKIPLSRVVAARAVRNSWLCGWGIRRTGGGWMWNASGLEAVELTFSDGSRFRIGTDEPDVLCETIRREAGLGGPPAKED
jgi:hypothetical protein